MIKIKELAKVNGMFVVIEATENGILVLTTTKVYKLVNNKLIPIDTKPDENDIIAIKRASEDQRLQDQSQKISKHIENYRIKVETNQN